MKTLNVLSLYFETFQLIPKGINWNEIKTPIFPFLFTIISGASFGTIPFKMMRGRRWL